MRYESSSEKLNIGYKFITVHNDSEVEYIESFVNENWSNCKIIHPKELSKKDKYKNFDFTVEAGTAKTIVIESKNIREPFEAEFASTY